MADAARWSRVWELFHEARELPPDEREALLAGAADLDPALRAEVESLLAARDDDPAFLADHRLIEPLVGPEDDPLLGRTIAGYRLAAIVGEGGMGTVYEAEQTEPVRRRVAFKVVKLGMDTREVIARFEAERQALALMDHPGIAAVYGGGATGEGRPYFVMEWVEGSAGPSSTLIRKAFCIVISNPGICSSPRSTAPRTRR